MLRHKDSTKLSELNDFFTSGEKAISTIFRITSSLTLSGNKILGKASAANNIYQNQDKLILLLLFPFFKIKDAYHYHKSSLYNIFSCGKDVFYRLLNDENIDWRSLNYSISKKLVSQTQTKTQSLEGEVAPRCLIVDDTDSPKQDVAWNLSVGYIPTCPTGVYWLSKGCSWPTTMAKVCLHWIFRCMVKKGKTIKGRMA